VVLFIKVVLIFESVDEVQKYMMIIDDEIKATEQYFPVVLFIILREVREILTGNGSNEIYRAILLWYKSSCCSH